MALTKIGASLGGSADIITVTQGSHGFVSNDRGKAVKMTNVSGTPTYILATANTTANADAIGIIIQIIDSTKFIIALSGRITVDAAIITYGGSPVAGTVLFLPTASALGVANSVQNSGHLTPTEPSGTNEISKPMAVVTVAGSEMVMLQQRGEVISTAGATIADDAITNAKLANMAANTVKVNATTGSANPTDISMASANLSGAIADGDVLLVYDASTTSLKTVAKSVLVAGIGGQSFTGDTTITSGNLVMATPGKGIDFSARTPDAGGMANEILDDYEEGTWSPELWDDGNNDESAEYSTQDGKYTKIGNVVYYSFRMLMTGITNLTTTNLATIGGLPFAPSGSIHGGGGLTYQYGLSLSTGSQIMFMVESTSPELSMYQPTTTNSDGVRISEVTAGGLIQGVGHYLTAT